MASYVSSSLLPLLFSLHGLQLKRPFLDAWTVRAQLAPSMADPTFSNNTNNLLLPSSLPSGSTFNPNSTGSDFNAFGMSNGSSSTAGFGIGGGGMGMMGSMGGGMGGANGTFNPSAGFGGGVGGGTPGMMGGSSFGGFGGSGGGTNGGGGGGGGSSGGMTSGVGANGEPEDARFWDSLINSILAQGGDGDGEVVGGADGDAGGHHALKTSPLAQEDKEMKEEQKPLS
jgi:hypothetical protein